MVGPMTKLLRAGFEVARSDFPLSHRFTFDESSRWVTTVFAVTQAVELFSKIVHTTLRTISHRNT